jgi:hypothetical protein
MTMEHPPLTITLDTNTFPLERALSALRGRRVDVATTTVTTRELAGSDWHSESLTLRQLAETWVLGESPLGTAVLGSEEQAAFFENALRVLTNGSFPRRGQRGALTASQRRQMRDAMAFCTHVREGRDIFVTNDKKAFGINGSDQRQRVEALGARVMTLVEFEEFCRSRSAPAP